MSDDPDEQDLARRFAELRPVVESAAGSSRRLLARRRRPPAAVSLRFRLAAGAAGIALTAGMLLILKTRPGPEDQLPPAAAVGSWRSSTDFLLATPGAELLGSVSPSSQEDAGAQPDAPETKNEEVRR